MKLNDAELATVLFALRRYCRYQNDDFYGDTEPLDANEIDGLCERLKGDDGPQLFKKIVIVWGDSEDEVCAAAADAIDAAKAHDVVAFGIAEVDGYAVDDPESDPYFDLAVDERFLCAEEED